MFRPLVREKFSVGDSFAVIGRSGSGKSSIVEHLLTNFTENFAEKLDHCRNVVILYRVLQPSYQRLLALFPDSCRKILSRNVEKEWLETGFWTQNYDSPLDYSLLICDDLMESLAAKNSLELDLLSSLLFVGLHHSRAILIVTLQSIGTSDSSHKLRMLIKQFSVYILMSGLSAPVSRYLSTFLSPYKASVLVSLINALPRQVGSYCVVDNRLKSRHRFSFGSILCSKNQIYMIFE